MEAIDTLLLTNVIHERTEGNVFFFIRLLENLIDDGLLTFSLGLVRWRWDVDRLRTNTSISDNVVDLMANKIRKKLSEEERSVLTLAACFGSRFDAHLLQEFIEANETKKGIPGQDGEYKEEAPSQYVPVGESLDSSLRLAIKEGILERDSLVSSPAAYRFAHDRIHQAAYSLIPAGADRELLHLKIGDLIYEQRNVSLEKKDKSQNTDWMLFVATDQLNIGSNQYTKDESEKRKALAKLNLEAGQKAMQSSAFVPAASYLNKGINLLDTDTHWDDDFDLSLQLYNASSSAEYGCGHYDRSKRRAETILAKASLFHHKTIAIYNICKILRNERKNEEALDFCMEILAEEGLRMSRNPTWPAIRAEVLITRQMLNRRSDQDIQALPALNKGDVRSLVAQFMCPFVLTTTHRLFRYDLTTLSTVRSLQLMLRNGVSPFCPFALAVFGSILCKEGHTDEGRRCIGLAMSMMKTLGIEKSWKPTVDYYAYSYIHHWVDGHHIQECLDPLLHNYEAAMVSGDIYIAFGSVYSYSMIYLNSGLSLGAVEEDLKAYGRQMAE